MTLIYRLFCLITVHFIAYNNGEYGVKTFSTTIVNTEANNHEIPITIHYPSANVNEQYHVMVFYHGWECMITWYDFIWQTLVPLGLIVAMPNDYTASNTTNENECAITQRYTLDWIKQCNTNPSCPLYQLVSDKSIAIGHSMGGGVTFLSSSSNYSLQQTFKYSFDAAFTFAGCGDANDIIQAVKYIDIPIFIFTASHDCMCPPNSTALLYYRTIPNDTCKYIADITNGTHCGFMDAPPLHQDACNAIDTAACARHSHQNIALKAQINIVMKYLALFVNATMKDIHDSYDFEQMGVQLAKDTKNGIMTSSSYMCGEGL